MKKILASFVIIVLWLIGLNAVASVIDLNGNSLAEAATGDMAPANNGQEM